MQLIKPAPRPLARCVAPPHWGDFLRGQVCTRDASRPGPMCPSTHQSLSFPGQAPLPEMQPPPGLALPRAHPPLTPSQGPNPPSIPLTLPPVRASCDPPTCSTPPSCPSCTSGLGCLGTSSNLSHCPASLRTLHVSSDPMAGLQASPCPLSPPAHGILLQCWALSWPLGGQGTRPWACPMGPHPIRKAAASA